MIYIKRDYYIDGKWNYRSPCPWKHHLTPLGQGYQSDEEAARAVQWNEAEHSDKRLKLIVVKREWTETSTDPMVL